MIQHTSKCIGKTFEDIWELIIGNRLHYARKKQEYKYEQQYKKELRKYKEEIEKEINKICEEKQVTPEFHTISILLEDAELCLDSKVIRSMFAKLIASTMNEDTKEYVHPIFGHILKHMDHNDAIVFETISAGYSKHLEEVNSRVKVEFSVRVLMQLGLIYIGGKHSVLDPFYGYVEDIKKDTYEDCNKYLENLFGAEGIWLSQLLSQGFNLTELGRQFAKLCL